MKILSGWGRFPKVYANEVFPNNIKELKEILSKNPRSYIARGNGRSYGDAAINKSLTINITKLNNIISWDKETGILKAEAGTLIKDVIEHCLKDGWFPYVTPGTKYVTLGGSIACDVHGKNHHLEGSFGNYVKSFELLDKNNNLIKCSPNQNYKCFKWTIGGMGLTGVITKCTIQLKKISSGWINQTLIKNNNLVDTLSSFEEFNGSTYSVAWIDCLAKGKNFGRSIIYTGEHASSGTVSKKNIFPKARKKMFSLKITPPSFILNNLTVMVFNWLYFSLRPQRANSIVDWDKYFYPLDSIGHWNKLYGRNGFFQFQCVLPLNNSQKGCEDLLKLIQSKGSGAFLAVLKRFGKGNGYMSFPIEGITIAIDFKVSKKNIELANQLHKIVSDNNGKIYLAKDSLLKSDINQEINIKSMANDLVQDNRVESQLFRRLNAK